MFHTLKPDLAWEKDYLYSVLPILLAILFFSVYWFIAQSGKVKKKFYNSHEHDRATLKHISFNRIAGFLLMGVLPVSVCLVFFPEYSLKDFGMWFNPAAFGFSVISVLVLSLLNAPIVSRSARKPENLVNYPQIRARIWTRETVIVNALTWALYLLGYEFLFRGVLLFPLVNSIGIWPAIAINIALYSATHIPKGMSETIGAAPLGLVLCILTLHSGTIWIAFVVHLVIALTNSFTALKFNPEMKYVSSGKTTEIS